MTPSLLALNAILMFSVVAGIVTLLAWAIRTQHRDRTAPAFLRTDRAVRPARTRPRAASQPHRRPITGGA